MIRKFIVAFVLSLFVMSPAAFAEPQIIRATGYGSGPSNWDKHDSFYKNFARQAARMDALRKLAEKIGTMQVTSETHVDPDGNLESGKVKIELIHDSKVFELLKNHARQVGKARFLEDGICEVDMEVVVPDDWNNDYQSVQYLML